MFRLEPFVIKVVWAALSMAAIVLGLGGTVHDAQIAMQAIAALAAVIATRRGEP